MFLKLKEQKLLGIIIHIIVWMVVFSFPFLLSTENEFSWNIFAVGPFTPMIFAAIVFYLNYLFVIDRFLLRKKYLLFILINLLTFAILIAILEYIRSSMMPPPMDFGHKPFPEMHENHSIFSSLAFKDFLTFTISLIFCIAIKVTRQLVNTEKEKQRIEKENIQSTLMLLKYQVQPHFFFNSLNNIYALIESSPKIAQDALYNLGKLMRYLLYEKEFVRLDEEIEFLKKYIALMELRLRDNIKLRVSFPEDTERYQIAPLLMIPLIENAYKHGISSTETSIIFIDMQIKNNRLHFLVENTYFPKDESDKSGSGIGLNNLKQRLDMIYKGKYQLLQNIENGIFRIELIIDIEEKIV
jgi:sensor histidine kinase YesM